MRIIEENPALQHTTYCRPVVGEIDPDLEMRIERQHGDPIPWRQVIETRTSKRPGPSAAE
jgi:hypothetical protein